MDRGSGALGETFAAKQLERDGFTILERNYHSRYGEIDIIAEGAPYILFVEVKTRRRSPLVSPMEAVTFSKQEKLRKTALCYLQEHPEAQALQPRFDVAAVWTDDAGKTVLESRYLPGAF